LDEMGKRLICLPGVPAEMRYLMENSVSDIIKKLILDLKKRLVKYKTIITSGIFESNLAELIGPATKYPSGISLAYLPSSKGVRLRIGASGINFDDAETTINNFESMILPKIKNYIIGYGKDDLITLIHQILVDNNLTISVAESCTSGMLGSELGSLPGSSSFLVGGIITYSNDVKNNILGVNKLTIAKHGAVSKETAIEMARLVRNKFGSSIGISITGIAGPDGGTDEKPVGTVFIGYADANESTATKFIFGNDRTQNRERAVTQSLLILKERILKNENISN